MKNCAPWNAPPRAIQGMRLNLAINYSARVELVDAVNALIDEARIEGRLSSLVIDEKHDFAAPLHRRTCPSRIC